MFDRDVTMSASTEARAQAWRTASCRRLSVALGACDMDRGQELFEGGDGGNCMGTFLFYRGIDRRGRRGRRRSVHQELLGRLLEGEAVGGVRGRFRLHLSRQVGDRLLEIRIVPREGERGAVLREGFDERALPMEDIGQATNRGKVLGSAPQHLLQLLLRVRELLELDKRASKGHTGGQIRGMHREPCAAHVDRFLKHRGATVLFGELGEGDGRRVVLDPSSEVFET